MVVIGDDEHTPIDNNLTDDEILMSVPASVRAGINPLKIVHRIPMGAQDLPHRGEESNVVPFVLLPTVADATVPDTGHVKVTFNPAIGKDQRLLLLLNEKNPPATQRAHAYTFDAPLDNGITDPNVDTTTSVTFDISNVATGLDYYIRVSVDGAMSQLSDGMVKRIG